MPFHLIEPWQYVAFGVAAAIAVALSWRVARRDRAFWQTLETTIVDAAAAHLFVLTSKEHLPNSFGHRMWRFERAPRAIVVYWDGKQEDFTVELQEPGPSAPARKEIASFYFPKTHQEAVDRLLEAVNAAVRADTEARGGFFAQSTDSPDTRRRESGGRE